MAKDRVVKRKVECPNPQCGNTLYIADYDYLDDEQEKMIKVWRCTNCRRVTPRHGRNRKTNRARALELWRTIKAEWQETDQTLMRIVEEGKAKSGAILVYSYTWNFHMKQLLEKEKPTTFDVGYHSAQARADLQKAKNYVQEKLQEK